MKPAKFNESYICYKTYRNRNSVPEILEGGEVNPDFYPTEHPEGRPEFSLAHRDAWMWHHVYHCTGGCGLAWRLLELLRGEEELFFVDDLTSEVVRPITKEIALQLLPGAIMQEFSPGEYHSEDRSSDRLRGRVVWGVGRREDGSPYWNDGTYESGGRRVFFGSRV